MDGLAKIEKIVIHTSHHTHNVIGTGAGDPHKVDPKASRETLDPPIMGISGVALQDGERHHERGYAPKRAGRRDIVLQGQRTITDNPPLQTRICRAHWHSNGTTTSRSSAR